VRRLRLLGAIMFNHINFDDTLRRHAQIFAGCRPI